MGAGVHTPVCQLLLIRKWSGAAFVTNMVHRKIERVDNLGTFKPATQIGHVGILIGEIRSIFNLHWRCSCERYHVGGCE